MRRTTSVLGDVSMTRRVVAALALTVAVGAAVFTAFAAVTGLR